MEEIQNLLCLAIDPCSENQLTMTDVKRWLADYMEMRMEEDARFQGEADASHWDLIVADNDSAKEGPFIAAYFSGNQITLLSGWGPVRDIRTFAQNTFPDNPDDVLQSLEKSFNIGERWTTDVHSVASWAET